MKIVKFSKQGKEVGITYEIEKWKKKWQCGTCIMYDAPNPTRMSLASLLFSPSSACVEVVGEDHRTMADYEKLEHYSASSEDHQVICSLCLSPLYFSNLHILQFCLIVLFFVCFLFCFVFFFQLLFDFFLFFF
nr:hypothetical protein Iba_chr13aCG0640 [Ipomoea batatas]